MEKKSNFNKFLTLLENDFCRNLKLILPLMGAFWVLHLFMAWQNISKVDSVVKMWLSYNDVDEALKLGQKVSFYNVYRHGSISSVMNFSVIAIMLYTIVLWEREWFGSSKSIYTLLSLPVKRTYIIGSKLLTMLIFVGFNVVIQIGTLFIDNAVMKLRIEERLIDHKDVLMVFATSGRNNLLNLMSRNTWVLVLTLITTILLLSLVVLLFRSFKIKGLIFGIILFCLFFWGYVYTDAIFNLYWDEKLIFRTIFSIITSILTFNYCKYLLNKKVTV